VNRGEGAAAPRDPANRYARRQAKGGREKGWTGERALLHRGIPPTDMSEGRRRVGWTGERALLQRCCSSLALCLRRGFGRSREERREHPDGDVYERASRGVPVCGHVGWTQSA